MSDLQVIARPPRDLRANKANARTHSADQIKQIGRSIRSFGFNNPVLIDADDEIIAGHGRVAAAIALDMACIPTVRLEHLTPAQKRAYVLADNRLAELAGWDDDLLKLELQGLLEAELDFDLTDTGFEMPEIDALVLGNAQTDVADPADTPVPLADIPAYSRPGDLWLLGRHRLFCGDALDVWSYRTLLEAETASMVFTDPPYNVPVRGHVSGKGRLQHREFLMASGEMSADEFEQFLSASLTHAADASRDGAMHFVCMDWRHLQVLLRVGMSIYSDLANLCVWVKANGGMGSLYRSQHELVAVFKHGRAKHINNVQLGRHGRNRTNVWSYAGMNSFQADREEALSMHPTVKPVAMVADAILDCSERGDVVLDPFGGSGTTLLAAERTGRRGFVMELDPRYVDVSLHRFVQMTGRSAINAFTGAVIAPQSAEELKDTKRAGATRHSEKIAHAR